MPEHIDPTALDAYREMMGDEADSFVADILDTYLTNSLQLLADMETGLAAADAASFTRAAHTFKSNSAMCGAHPLAALALQLEQAGKTGQLTGLTSILEQLKVEYGLARAELQALRRSLPV